MPNVFELFMVSNYCSRDQEAKCNPHLNKTNPISEQHIKAPCFVGSILQ